MPKASSTVARRTVANRDPGGPLIVGIGSGGGGIGRTTLAMELARAFTHRQVSTLLVDCAVTLPVIAELMDRKGKWEKRAAGLSSPVGQLAEFMQREGPGEPAVLTLADPLGESKKSSSAAPARLVERLRRLEERVILLDLPAGPQPFWLDVMILADIPLVVSGPEAWSVMTLVGFLQVLIERSKERLPAGRVKSYLVLNGCRDTSERDLGEVLCHAIWRRLGHYPRYLGPIDFDDRRWFHLRHGDASTPLSSSLGMGVQTEDIAKRILDLEEFNQCRPRPPLDPDEGPPSPGLLGLSEAASSNELRSQYRRLWEGYRRESAISQVLYTGAERDEIISELERTYRALQMIQDEGRSLGEPPATVEAGRSAPPRSPRGEGAAQVTAKMGEGGGHGHCGEYLRRARKARHLSLRELSLRTRIAVHHLEVIETLEVDRLPLPVYLRGYLREIARVLELPVDSVLDRYLTELAHRRQEDTTNPV